MCTTYCVHSLVQFLADANGFLLKRNHPDKLGEFELGLMLALLCLVAWLLVCVRASRRAVLGGFAAVGIVYLAAMAVLATLDFDVFRHHCMEEHSIEWFSAVALLVASAVCLTVAIRQAVRRRPCPMALLLSIGFLWGFGRETEWGEPFFGEKIFYSRNMFRLRAYIDPAYFDKFSRSLELEDCPVSMYTAHLVFSFVVVALIAVLVIYLIRHRQAFAAQLRELHRTAYGRYFLFGAGVYLCAQVGGTIFDRVCKSSSVVDWGSGRTILTNRVLAEPVELLGAMSFLVAAAMLWRLCFHPAAERSSAGQAAGPQRQPEVPGEPAK